MPLKYESISIPEGRTYSPPTKWAVVSLPLVGLVRSAESQPIYASVNDCADNPLSDKHR